MSNNFISENSLDWQKFRVTNCTDTSFASVAMSLTRPTPNVDSATGATYIRLRDVPGEVSTRIKLIPYGTGDANDVFVMRVFGLAGMRVGYSNETWMPVTLAELTCTMSAYTGIANGYLATTDLICDTIVGVTNKFNDDVSIDISSPADDTPAMVTLDLKGFRDIGITFDTTTGDPSGANCLYSIL